MNIEKKEDESRADFVQLRIRLEELKKIFSESTFLIQEPHEYMELADIYF